MTDRKPPLQEWQADMIRTVPDSLVRDLVNDFRRGPAVRSSLASRPGSQEPVRPVGGGSTPVSPPPGLQWVDRIAESFAATDRANAIREKLENELAISRLKKDGE